MKSITICEKTAMTFFAFGVIVTGSAWYGSNLHYNAMLTQAIIAQAKCDPNGTSHVSMMLPDGSEFMCTPRQFIPDSMRESAKRLKK
jgi:hypothetical protein